MLCKQIGLFEDFDKLRGEVATLLKSVKFSAEIPNQLSLQVADPTHIGASAWYSSIGRIDRPDAKIIEEDFKYIQPALTDGWIHKWIKSITEYNIVRARLMLVPGRTCYSIHKDPKPRIHIAIKTTPSSLVLFPEHKQMHHIPADGSVWFVDTRESHTVINCSTEPRIHLVGVVA